MMLAPNFLKGQQKQILERQQEQGKTRAIIIGIAEYNDLPNAAFSDDDALYFNDFATGSGISKKDISLLIDEDATRDNILKACKDIIQVSTAKDNIVFYYSGKSTALYLMPVDTKADSSNIVLYREIIDILKTSKAKNNLCIFDASYSGNIVQYIQEESTNITLLTSSGADEISIENGGIKRGWFTHFLLRALTIKGHQSLYEDEKIELYEVYEYTLANVAKQTKKEQLPRLFTGPQNLDFQDLFKDRYKATASTKKLDMRIQLDESRTTLSNTDTKK